MPIKIPISVILIFYYLKPQLFLNPSHRGLTLLEGRPFNFLLFLLYLFVYLKQLLVTLLAMFLSFSYLKFVLVEFLFQLDDHAHYLLVLIFCVL